MRIIMKTRVLVSVALALACLCQAGAASAGYYHTSYTPSTSYLDLTSNKSKSFGGDAMFSWGGPGTSGEQETVNSFKQQSSNDYQSGMNTNYDGSKFKDNESTGGTLSNHGFKKEDMCLVNYNGKDYYQFTLNLSQDSTSPGESLDDFKIYYSSNGTLNDYSNNYLHDSSASYGKAGLAFDMDNQTDSTGKSMGDMSILMDSSKSSKYTFSVLASNFDKVNGNDYIYIYSTMGKTGDTCKGLYSSCKDRDTGNKVGDLSYKSNGDTEEWTVDKCKPKPCGDHHAPEPQTLAMLGLGMLGMVWSRRRSA